MSAVSRRTFAGAVVAAALVAAAPASTPKRLSITSQTPVTAKGSLKGDQSVDYVFAGTAGHTLSVTMTTTNRAAYFNLTAPGADTAMFIGSIDGNRFSGKLPETGDYQVRVYLMRSAARRNEKADFSLRAWVLPTR